MASPPQYHNPASDIGNGNGIDHPDGLTNHIPHDLALHEDGTNDASMNSGNASGTRIGSDGLIKTPMPPSPLEVDSESMEDEDDNDDLYDFYLDRTRKMQRHRRSQIFNWICLAVVLIIVLSILLSRAVGGGDSDSDDGRSSSPNQNGSLDSSSDDAPSSSPTADPVRILMNSWIDNVLQYEPLLNTSGLRDVPLQSSTPQYKALEYMSTMDDAYLSDLLGLGADPGLTLHQALQDVSGRDREFLIERYILIVFYFGLNGPQWDTNGKRPQVKFLTNTSVCDWTSGNAQFGMIDCDHDGMVSVIDLAGHEITGDRMPTEIGALGSVQKIYLGEWAILLPTDKVCLCRVLCCKMDGSGHRT
uniref:Uncharacterized protein n=1 Tax=Craspedostauros australis TaxID=1486917 RepID=A0A7R9X133_9STRA